MDSITHRIPQLILKQFNQTITSSEEKELNDWIQSSDHNKSLYNEITDARNLTIALKRHFSYDVESAKNKFRIAIGEKRYGKRRFISILKYAAIIIPLLATTFFIVNEIATPVAKNLFAVKDFDFQPGSKKAVLKLDNGEEINLGKSKTANEIKIDRMTKAIDRDFSLVYDEGLETIENVANNTLRVPVGGEYKLVLADETKVWLNSNTQITFPVQFNGDLRKVQVLGEAYFEVVHNPQKPFIVETPSYAVEVLGTSFNVMSYQDEEQSATTLIEGKVKISNITDEKSIVLEPGEQASLNYKSRAYSVQKVDVVHYTAWKDGLFSFQSAPLSEIMRRLSRWYNCDFQFEEASLKDLHFTGTLDKHQNLKDLLRLIAETCSVNFNVNEEYLILISSK